MKLNKVMNYGNKLYNFPPLPVNQILTIEHSQNQWAMGMQDSNTLPAH